MLFKERTKLESYEGYSVAKLINETKEKIDPKYKNQLRFPTKDICYNYNVILDRLTLIILIYNLSSVFPKDKTAN